MKKIVYEAIKDRISLTYHEWVEATKEWEYRPIKIKNNLSAIVMINKSEVHVITTPEYKGRGLSRRLFKSILSEVFNKHGIVTTKVSGNHEIGHRLARFLGFKLGDDGIYRIEVKNVWCE